MRKRRAREQGATAAILFIAGAAFGLLARAPAAQACQLLCEELVHPPIGATGVPTNTLVWFRGTYGLEDATLLDPTGAPVPATIEVGLDHTVLRPAADLAPDTTYRVEGPDWFADLTEPPTFTTGVDRADTPPPAPVLQSARGHGRGTGACAGGRGVSVRFDPLGAPAAVVALYVAPRGGEFTEIGAIARADGGFGLAGGFCAGELEAGAYEVAVRAFDAAGNGGELSAPDVARVPACSLAAPGRRLPPANVAPAGVLLVLFLAAGFRRSRAPRR